MPDFNFFHTSGLEEDSSVNTPSAYDASASGAPCEPRPWDDELIAEFLSLASKGDIPALDAFLQTIEGGALPSDTRQKGYRTEGALRSLWQICCEQANKPLLNWLLAKGASLEEISADTEHCFMGSNTLLLHTYSGARDPGTTQTAVRFIEHVLDLGLVFDPEQHASPYYLARTMGTFGPNIELYDRLNAAGLPFKGATASDNVELVLNLSKRGCAWAVDYVFDHGAVIHGNPMNLKYLMDWWEANPDALAKLVIAVSPEAISPANALAPIVAKSGNLSALKALETWPDALNKYNLSTAIAAASEAGFTEVTAYLMATMNDDFDLEFDDLEFDDFDEDIEAPELFDAIACGAVTVDKVLVSAERLLDDGEILVPEGVKEVADQAFTNFFSFKKPRFVYLPDSLRKYPDAGTIKACALSLPESGKGRFEEIFLSSRPDELFVRQGDSVCRVIADVVAEDKRWKREGDPEEAYRSVWEGVGKDYCVFLRNIDIAIENGVIAHVKNVSRFAVARLIDSAELSDEHRAMYAKLLLENQDAYRQLFADEGNRMFAKLLPKAVAIAEALS